MLDRNKVKAALTHGKQAEIARRAGVTEGTVSNWFKGLYNSVRLEDAAIEVYGECVAAAKARKAKLAAAERGEKI